MPIVAEALAGAVTRARGRPLPAAARETCERLLIDIGGLCVAARHTDYVRAAHLAYVPLPGGDVSRLRALDFEKRSDDDAGAFVECVGRVCCPETFRFLLPHHIGGRDQEHDEHRVQREPKGATLHEGLPSLMMHGYYSSES